MQIKCDLFHNPQIITEGNESIHNFVFVCGECDLFWTERLVLL